MTGDIIEIRLPPKPDHLPVLHAAVGVIAGTMSFHYDQIIQLRAAVSEAFDLAVRCISRGGPGSQANELAVRFVVEPQEIRIMIPAPGDYTGHFDSAEDQESQALLHSLVDELKIGATSSEPIVSMVKYKPGEGT